MKEYKPNLPTESYGDVPVGCHIIYEGNEYVLGFGWHTNYSNQTIYSWFLTPVKDITDLEINTGYDSLSLGIPAHIRTLYKDMIPKISGVRYLPAEESEEVNETDI